jgi:hypothetical protein
LIAATLAFGQLPLEGLIGGLDLGDELPTSSWDSTSSARCCSPSL